jgi:hypothetical protein
MQWVKCKERLPTRADADEVEQVVVFNGCAWCLDIVDWRNVDERMYEFWLEGACEREDRPGD